MLLSRAMFPNLHPGNHVVTSPLDFDYNCIAWAAGIDNAWWQPVKTPGKKTYWPGSAPSDYKLTSLIAAYESVGFVLCADGIREQAFEKIAIFADGDEYMHAARQLETGKWSSKLGELEDIEHDTPDAVAGRAYGQVAVFLKRERALRAQTSESDH